MIEYLEYKGEKLPFRISYYALSKFQQETGLSIDTLETEIDTNISVLEPILYFALEAGHRSEGKEFKIKREDIAFLLDEVMNEFMTKMGNFSQEAAPKKGKKKPLNPKTAERKKVFGK